jgi:hypothetical protein
VSTNPNSALPAQVRAPSIEDLAIRSGMTSEHVVLSGDELIAPERARSAAVKRRLRLRNRATGTETVLRIYRDGHLSAIESRRGGAGPERVVDLRFLEPSPRLSRSVARTALRTVLGCLAAGTASAICAFFSILPLVSGSAAGLLLTGAVAASFVYVRRSRERIEFRTLHGGAVVLTLIANIGSVRAHRKAVPKIVAAIREAHRLGPANKQTRLREEMREHYRLASAGIITDQACAMATRKILERF